MKKYLSVGQIVNTHGVNGEVKVYPLTDDVRRFRKLKKVYIDGVEKNIVWSKPGPKVVVMKIEGVDTIEAAMKFRDKYIDVSREDAVKLPEGRYYVPDLIGCNVWDEEGKDLGKVADVIFTPSNEVYWIKKDAENNIEELLIPALKHIVVSVDIETQKIVIKPVKQWLAE